MNEDARINIPLVQGEYHRPSTIRAGAQMLFLDIVAKATPAPLYDLRDRLLPKFRSAFETEKAKQQSIVEISKTACNALVDLTYSHAMVRRKVPAVVRSAMKAHAPIYDACAALIDWSDKFNLKGKRREADSDADTESTFEDRHWPMAVALHTILFWQFHPAGAIWALSTPPRWCPPVIWLRVPDPACEPLPHVNLRVNAPLPDNNGFREVEPAGWCTEIERAGQFRRRIRTVFDTWIENYIASCRISAEKGGLKKPPGKRRLARQFDWTAKYQIEKVPSAKIALACGVDTDTVDEGIEAALKLIHLEKRPPGRGPARKGRFAS